MSSGDKSGKKSRKPHLNGDENDKTLTKEETAIARYLRLSCPNKTGNLQGMKVEFFIASRLVDSLMDSKWGPGLKKDDPKKPPNPNPLLASRQACVSFMSKMMNKELFHRAVKVYKEDKEEETSGTPSANVRRRKNKGAVVTENTEAAEGAKAEAAAAEDTTEDTPNPKTSRKEKEAPEADKTKQRKFKLDMHDHQVFIDANEPYVWIYDPTTTKSFVIGLALVLGSIAICCFPLWPNFIRDGVYYVSLTGASLLGGIIGLALFKYVLYAAIWAITIGKVSFWLFPNLTEDVGFFDSFKPLYMIGDERSVIKTIEKAVTSAPLKDSVSESAANLLTLIEENANVVNGKETPKGTKGTPRRGKTSKEEDEGFELVGDEEEEILVNKEKEADSQ